MSTDREIEAIPLLRRLILWYKRDQIVHLWLATHYASKQKFLIASILLYHALRNFDAFLWYSGKSVRIRLHLLLAQVYEQWNPYQTEWRMHAYVEAEYKRAISLADLELPDARPEDFEIVFHNYLSDKDAREAVGNYMKELGLIPYIGTEMESRALRAIAHHRYAGFLQRQMHREHDALAEEKKASEQIEFGESYVSCAILNMKLCNFKASLEFLEKAEKAKSRYIPADIYSYMLLRERTAALIALGKGKNAEETYAAAITIVKTSSAIDDEWRLRFESEMAQLSPKSSGWKNALELARQRSISFEADRMVYSDFVWGTTFILPSDWKVVEEGRGVDRAFIIFSSQIRWDDFTRIPHNASITIELNRETGNQEKGIPEFFAALKDGFSRQEKFVWEQGEMRTEQGEEIMQCSFMSTGKFGKTGRLVIVKRSDLFMVFHMMCLSASKETFFPVFDAFLTVALNYFSE